MPSEAIGAAAGITDCGLDRLGAITPYAPSDGAELPHRLWDVAIAGGGPAGLAAAIVAARQGLSVVVLERRKFPPDKACGEGLLPPGVSALERLGVKPALERDARVFKGIRFIQENGTAAEAPLPGSGGLGIRRTVLVEAMRRRAEELGAVLRSRCTVAGAQMEASEAALRTSEGIVRARLLVAADGLHSPLRHGAGLSAVPSRRRRFALRQHFRVAPWTDYVEVYADRRAEAYVTPVSDDNVNVSFVWEDGAIERPSIDFLLGLFPALRVRLGDAARNSHHRGAGPLTQRVLGRTRDRMVLIGDAAGFIDSISADGLSIAFNSALALGRHLPAILAGGATRDSMRAYERDANRLFRGYWLVTNCLLFIARHPRLRTAIIGSLARNPGAFRALMNGAMRMMVSAA